MMTEVTHAVAYPLPIGAVHRGQQVRIIALGDRKGSSPVLQYINTNTGDIDWAPQSEFKVFDSNFLLSKEALTNALTSLRNGPTG